jgi:UDP-glucose 4-epimerase
MRVVIVGATGNIGTSLIRALEGEDRVGEIVGVARRAPSSTFPKTTWVAADITRSDLEEVFRGADAVVHLAWAIQPSHSPHVMRRINIVGTERVLSAVSALGIPNFIYASSIGAYSPGPKDRVVDESWPTDGVLTSFYSRHKARVERMLDSFEAERPGTRVVRLRKALVFKKEAGSEVRRLFIGPFFPNPLANPKALPFVPKMRRLRTQAVHSLDAGEAYRLALVSDVRGPFNIAADPILEPESLAALLGARAVPVPAGLVRGIVDLTWKLRLQPTQPGWLDIALQSPLMDPSRAARELGWTPLRSSHEAVLEALEGLREEEGEKTPPLDPEAGGRFREREVLTGVGQVSAEREESP